MRRLMFWYIPLAGAVVATLAFGAGFYSFLRGDVGKPVDLVPSRQIQAEPPKGLITPIIVGDSLARGTGDESGLGIGGRLTDELKRKRLNVRPTVNLAVNGAKTNDLLQQLDSPNVRTLLAQSNVIIISIGGNDLWGGTDWRSAPPKDPDAVMRGVIERIDKVVKIIRGVNKSSRIFIVGLYNPFAATPYGPQLTSLVNEWNAKLIEQFNGDVNVTVIQTSDLFSHHDRLSFDRFHPNEEGYALIARRIAESI
ncbi:MAG: GDSL-type esterase/lipase family protein [Thermoanaerobaculia bacterium]